MCKFFYKNDEKMAKIGIGLIYFILNILALYFDS